MEPDGCLRERLGEVVVGEDRSPHRCARNPAVEPAGSTSRADRPVRSLRSNAHSPYPQSPLLTERPWLPLQGRSSAGPAHRLSDAAHVLPFVVVMPCFRVSWAPCQSGRAAGLSTISSTVAPPTRDVPQGAPMDDVLTRPRVAVVGGGRLGTALSAAVSGALGGRSKGPLGRGADPRDCRARAAVRPRTARSPTRPPPSRHGRTSLSATAPAPPRSTASAPTRPSACTR